MAIRLTGALQEYAWGSRTALHDFLGTAPTGRPAAELWYGAHPAAPSLAHVGDQPVPLDALLLADPALLGAGTELPFLVKVLSADRALSLQVHPGAEQAARGFAAGEVDASGAPRFVDARPKPELIVALSPFRALSGVRPAEEVRRLVAALDVPALTEALAPYGTGSPTAAADGLRALLSLDPEARVALVTDVRKAAAAAGSDPVVARAADLVEVLQGDHPDDVGVVAALLLNDLDLAPGEALYQPAGVLHAYVRGTGVEVMASSDNVLRCGLTPKRIDVEGLFACLDPAPVAPQRPVVAERPWRDPSGSFSLARLVCQGEPVDLDVAGPSVVLCTEGEVEVVHGTSLPLSRGAAALVPSGTRAHVRGHGEVFVAST